MQKSPSARRVSSSRRLAVKSWGRLLSLIALGLILGSGGWWGLSYATAPMQSRSVQGPMLTLQKPSPLRLTQPDVELTNKLALLAQQPKLRAGVFLVNLQTGVYVTQSDQDSYPAASTIKLPILLALLQDIEQDQVRWDETVTLTKELQVSGSGVLKGRPLGSKIRVWEAADLMISESDNIATELLIVRLGGREALNQRFAWWGLTQTQLKAPLPDITGQNRTSPQDLAVTLAYIDQGIGFSPWNRDRALGMMHRVVNRSFFVAGLLKVEPTAQIAHKTGTIGIGIGDAGLIDLPNGQRYLLTSLVERPREDRRAVQLLQNIASQVAQARSTPPN